MPRERAAFGRRAAGGTRAAAIADRRAPGVRALRGLLEEVLQVRRQLLLRRGGADLPGRGREPLPRYPEEARPKGPPWCWRPREEEGPLHGHLSDGRRLREPVRLPE